jgi:hypothetical protein
VRVSHIRSKRESQASLKRFLRDDHLDWTPSVVSCLPGTLKSLLAPQSRSFLEYQFGARGFGGRHAPVRSSRQLKEVIQVAHINVGSIAPLGALVGGEVHR